jgi:chromatin remodeling complex protein RSC6
MLIDAGKDTIKKVVDKKLGLDDRDFKKLERQSKSADFKKKIADSEVAQRTNRKQQAQEDAEKRAAEKKDTSKDDTSKKKDDTEYHTGTVSGEGTSRRSAKSAPVYDAVWNDVTVSAVPTRQRELGYNYVKALPDKKRKKK